MYLLEAIIGGNTAQIFEVILIFTIPFLFITLANVAFTAYDNVAREKIYVKIINEFLQKTIDLDLGYFDDTRSYDKYNRAFGNCCKVIDSINGILSNFITSIFNIIFIIGLLVWMDFYMFLVIIAVIAVSFLINNKLKKMDYDYSKLFSEKNKQVNYLYRLFYIPQFVRDVKANNLSEFIFKVKQDFNNSIIKLTREQSHKKVPYSIFLGSLGVLESGFVALYFGFSVVARRIAVSEFFTCINAYNQLKNTVMNLMGIYTGLYSNSLFASDYLEYLSSADNVTLNRKGIILEKVKKIEFVEVSFKYPNSNYFVLDKVSFRILAGEKVAILGKNGAGKTTIIKLLLRLYDPLSGDVIINGINAKEYNTKSLRRTIQTLFQDFAIYAFSIRDNISLGKDIGEGDILTALEEVGLKEKIENLKQNLETPITSQLYADGIELSGGEAQKLAIARVYAARPKTFVMDEPTSSLDPYAEHQLYNRLIKNTDKDAIVIVISHRLTLTHKMSKILVLEKGCMTEQGTHDELIRMKGVYFDMYNVQSEKYTNVK
jgi:ABC-type multidrug transport system fused ATPase/permease subunit